MVKILFTAFIVLGIIGTFMYYKNQSTYKLPNPASEHCIAKGGKVDIRKDQAGNEKGMCVFEDGRECDEWAFYREKNCI